MNNKSDDTKMDEASLSAFWYCPDDKTRLRPKTERVAHNPNFRVLRSNIDLSLSNAVSIRKIPVEAIEFGKEVAAYMFEHSEWEEVELVGTECTTCLKRYASPKLNRVYELKGINIGRALYDSQKKLETKYYGRFRFVNKFGLGSGDQNQRGGGRGGMRSLFLLGWFIGFFYIFAVIFLYYIIGMEVKIRDRFYPIGWLLLVLILLGILWFVISTNLDDLILNLLSGFR